MGCAGDQNGGWNERTAEYWLSDTGHDRCQGKVVWSMKKYVRLGDHTSKIGSGQTPLGGESSYAQSGVPLIRSQNVLMGSFSREGLAFISSTVDETMRASRVAVKDVLLNITGASIGRVCVVPDEVCPANVNQHVAIIRCSDSLHPEYVAAVLASPSFQAFIWECQAGGTRQALTKQMIENFEIPWLPINAQKDMTAKLRCQLAEVETARQAANTQLEDVSVLPSRIINDVFNEITGESTTLDDILVDIQAGKSFQTAETLAGPDELGVLKISAVTWTDFRPNEAKALKDVYDPAESHKVKNGDFIISRANTKEFVGAVVLVDRDFPNRLLSDKTLRLVVDESRVCKEFLLFALRASTARRHIEHSATGTSDSMRNISQGTITSIPICLPELDQQRRLAKQLKARLKEVNEIRSATEAQLQEIGNFPNRILAQAFES